jgi:hypothetical protein
MRPPNCLRTGGGRLLTAKRGRQNSAGFAEILSEQQVAKEVTRINGDHDHEDDYDRGDDISCFCDFYLCHG